VHALTHARDEEGLCEARNSHEKGVSPTEEADRELLHHLLLADDDLAQFLPEVAVDLPEFVDGRDIVGGQRAGFGRSRRSRRGGFGRRGGKFGRDGRIRLGGGFSRRGVHEVGE
jgi:hypothetical protein